MYFIHNTISTYYILVMVEAILAVGQFFLQFWHLWGSKQIDNQ